MQYGKVGDIWEVKYDVLLRASISTNSEVLGNVEVGSWLKQLDPVLEIEDETMRGLLRAHVEVLGNKSRGWVTVCAWSVGGPRYLKHKHKAGISTSLINDHIRERSRLYGVGGQAYDEDAGISEWRMNWRSKGMVTTETDEAEDRDWHYQPVPQVGEIAAYWKVLEPVYVRAGIRTDSKILEERNRDEILEQTKVAQFLTTSAIGEGRLDNGLGYDTVLLRIPVRLSTSCCNNQRSSGYTMGYTTCDARAYGGPKYLKLLTGYEEASSDFLKKRWRVSNAMIMPVSVTKEMDAEVPTQIGFLEPGQEVEQIGPFFFTTREGRRRMRIRTICYEGEEDEDDEVISGYVTTGAQYYETPGEDGLSFFVSC